MTAHHGPQRLQPVTAQHEPQFERAETPPEGDAPVAIVDDPVGLAALQEGRQDRQRPHQRRRIAHEVGRTVEIRQQPFVRIEDETVDRLDAFEHPPVLFAKQRAPGPGRVYVKEQPVFAGDLADPGERIDRADAGGAEAGDDAGRFATGADVGADRRRETRRLHGEGRVGFDVADVLAPVTGDLRALLGRRMGLVGHVDGERRLPRKARLVALPAGRAFARRQQRAKDGRRGGILDRPREPLRQADGAAQPVEHPGFHFGCRRRGLPHHALRTERRRRHFGEDRRRARIGGKEGEEAGMLPVRHAGKHDAPEIVEDRLHRLAAFRRRFGKRCGDRPRRRLRAHRKGFDAGHVVGHPVRHAMRVTTEFFGGHGVVTARRWTAFREPARSGPGAQPDSADGSHAEPTAVKTAGGGMEMRTGAPSGIRRRREAGFPHCPQPRYRLNSLHIMDRKRIGSGRFM